MFGKSLFQKYVRGCGRSLSLLLFMFLSGCALFGEDTADNDIPQELPGLEGPPIPYTTRMKVDWSGSTSDSGQVSDGELLAAMRKNSSLVQLADQPPDSMLALERRARVDQDNAERLLHSLGYYEGTASFVIHESLSASTSRPILSDRQTEAVEPDSGQPTANTDHSAAHSDRTPEAEVSLTLHPGPRYVVSKADTLYEPEPVVPDMFKNRTQTTGMWFWKQEEKLPEPVFPPTLNGIEPGSPAEADPILAAVSALPRPLHEQGYPFAKVSKTRYTLNREERSLNALAVVDVGPPALMGEPLISGTDEVSPEYLKRLVTWKAGQPWDARLMDEYRIALQQLGLFRSVNVRPQPLKDTGNGERDKADAGAESGTDEGTESGIVPQTPAGTERADNSLTVPVLVDVAETAFRTVSASARYSTDEGFGVQLGWEHRNFFGSGELLKLKAPVSQDLQGLFADFEKPAFGRRDQKLLASAAAFREESDAYTQRATRGSVGLERRLSRYWWAEGRLAAENGTLDEGFGVTDYRFLSVSLTVKRDTRDDPLNPTSGTRFSLTAAPHSGYYDGSFSMVAAKGEASGYYAPFGPDSVVLAGRVAAGTMLGANDESIPASLRYYAGGGGSVRGYAYQALGPRDAKGDPQGGKSFQEINLEARIPVTESIGVVPFVDAGMVYEDSFPKWGQDLDWAVGLGLRYLTPVGPVRVDLAFPLTRIGDDERYQLYISIGQAF